MLSGRPVVPEHGRRVYERNNYLNRVLKPLTDSLEFLRGGTYETKTAQLTENGTELWALRRTCARLCHAAGGELEQIQFLLGHRSVETTERYLGCRQRLACAVNDKIGIEPTPGAP
jgi:site-specific recombinase XerD